MKEHKSLNELFFIPNTRPAKEIDKHYELNDFYNVLVDVCDYCDDLMYMDEKRLKTLYDKYVDVFNENKNNLRNYFLKTITVQRFELKAYMIFGEELWKKTKGNSSLDYFLNRGYKYDYAVKLLKKRQTLTSEESFKERYGDDWEKHFNDYVNKHNETLNSNPNIDEIKKNRILNLTYEYYISKINPDTNKPYTVDEAKELISKKRRISSKLCSEKRRGKSGVTGRSVQYWINKGLSEEDAKNKVKTIQSTNTIEVYIKKYGEQEGITKWMERNKKWAENMQIKRIESGNVGNAYSQSSKIFFDKIVKKLNEEEIHFEKIYYGEKEFCKWDSENKRPYFYDFVIPEIKLCVEYNGLKFHPKEGDVSWVGLFGEQYEDKLQYDKIKQDVIKNCGYDVVVVWENDDVNKMIDDIIFLCKKKYFCYI